MFKRSSRPAGKLKVRNISNNSEIKNIKTPLPLPDKLKGEITIVRKSDPIIQKPSNGLKKLDVIIISVNYNDYLLVSLSHNIKIFENITVVTSSDDLMCQKICEKFGVNCIITDVMYENDAKFNKGKAINKGIESIIEPDFILLLDADIIVNDRIKLENIIDDNFYISDRWLCKDYNSYKRFIDGEIVINDIGKCENNKGLGFFQLFNINNNVIDKNKVFPEMSNDAAWSDLMFRDKFTKRKTIENDIIHLGDPYMNWNGRRTNRFLTDEQFSDIFQKKSTFTICSFYYNFRGDSRQKTNFIKFLDQWKGHYDKLIVGLVDYEDGDLDFEIPCEKIIIKGDKENKLWSKEIIINNIIDKIDTDYLLWIDGDIIYNNLDWLNNIDEVVGENDFVQLFETINYLGENLELLESHKSIVSSGSKSIDNLLGKGYKPGGSWLGKVSILKEKNLFEKMYVGGGDTIFMYGLSRIDNGFTLNKVKESNEDIYNESMEWINNFGQYKVGYLNETINHLYHGDLKDRNYNGRYKELKKENEKRILVIIPTFNEEKTIENSIKSVLDQTYRNIKCVVVLDGIYDNTEKIIKDITDTRLSLISNSSNLGTYQSINKALYQNRNDFDYFTIHGADDVMDSQKLKYQISMFDDSILAVSSGLRRIDYGSMRIVSEKIIGESMIIYKKEVFDSIGYYDNNRFGCDTEYYDRFILKFSEKKIHHTYKILSDCYYIGDKNLTIKINQTERINYIKNYKKIHNQNKYDLYRDYKSNKIQICMLSISDYAGSGEEIKKSILSVSDEFEMLTIRTKPHKYGYKSDYIITKDNIEQLQKIIDESDIIHFKGDEMISRNWFGLNIPETKKIIITVGGSGFRRGLDKIVCQEWHPISDYLKISNLRTTITPDLNYPEFEAIYTPHGLDIESKPYTWMERDIPIIQHSPSSRDKKGTDDIILPALQDLKKEGYKFIVELIENVSNEECEELKKNGTIFIDQISSTGFYGRSAIESMQYGIPTIAYISDLSKKQSNGFINTNCKVQSASNVEELKKTLRVLLTEKKLIKKLSMETKDYANSKHSYYFVGNMWSNIYKGILNKKKRILLSQYRPAIRLYKWAKTLKKMGYQVDILSTGDHVKNIDFSEFNIMRFDSKYDYGKDYDIHISFNTNITKLSHLNIKTIQAVGDLKLYYNKDVNSEKKSFESAYKIVFVSENQMKEALNFYSNLNLSEKSSVIINGIIDDLRPQNYKKKLNNGFINVVYSGTISDNENNHRYFINFFKKICDKNEIKLHVYPSAVGLPEAYKSIENLVIHNTVNPSELIEELSQYDCAILYLEGNQEIANSMLPNKFFEYLQAGLPIASGRYDEIIKFNKTRDCVSFFENENDVVDAIKKSQYITDKNQIINTIYYEDQMINIFKLIEQ